LDYLTYDGEILCASTAEALDEAGAFFEAFGDGDGNGSARGRDCGFDMECKGSFKKGSGEAKTSLGQIAAANDDLSEKLGGLGRIHTAGLTRRFKRGNRDSTRGKTGFNVRGDAKKLIRDFGLETSRVIELSALARERYEGGSPSAPSGSLARRCEHALGKTLPKDKTRKANWEREELKEEQIKYAARDARASLLVYRAQRARDLGHSNGDEPNESDPLPEPTESSEEELAEEDDEDDDEDDEERFVEDEDIR
jgi:Ribonuclease D